MQLAASCPLPCLGALPLLYPAAPPSVFAYFIGKYTAPAVELVREFPVGFLVLWSGLFFFANTTGSIAAILSYSGLVIWALILDLGIHKQSGFQLLLLCIGALPLLYLRI